MEVPVVALDEILASPGISETREELEEDDEVLGEAAEKEDEEDAEDEEDDDDDKEEDEGVGLLAPPALIALPRICALIAR